MDKFSQLVAAGVASFHHTPIAPETPTTDKLCRIYNNLYAMINDTHMSPLGDGRYVITGHMVAIKDKFEIFLNCSTYSNVDVRRYGAPNQLFTQLGLVAHYDTLNGDIVCIVEPKTDDPQ